MVVIIAFFPRMVGSFAFLPSRGLLQCFIALRPEVLVVQVVWASVAAGPVIMVAGKNAVDNLGVIQNLLRFRGYFKFFSGIVLIIGFPDPVFNDVTSVCVVGNLAFISVISNPLRGIQVGLFPDRTLFFRCIFYRTFDDVLGVSVV